MLLIFSKKIPNVYIAKVSKHEKKANNSPYKPFKVVLRVLRHHSIILVHFVVRIPKIGVLGLKSWLGVKNGVSHYTKFDLLDPVIRLAMHF